jgi:GT2 family glycosyltransferase
MISAVIISKDEPALDDTLIALQKQADDLDEPFEIVVVDASDGRLDHIRKAHESGVRWTQFERPAGVRITIPHQRNAGVRAAAGDVIVFTDSGCYPDPGWLASLTEPLRNGEEVTAGFTFATAGDGSVYGNSGMYHPPVDGYVTRCPTINMAFHRSAVDAVGGFDERFEYGSDIDFSWRLTAAGIRIRAVPEASIRHDWGSPRRQLRRSFLYGKAYGRLQRKHRPSLRAQLRDDPIGVIYPVFLLGLPITLVFPLYPLLLLIPAWRNRSIGSVRVVINHLAYGAGVLKEYTHR